jgi:hypothetical protein
MVSSSFFSSDVQDKIYLQVYPKAKDIEGVQFFPTKNILSDEGDFSELLRLDDQGKLEILPDFSLKQINVVLCPESIESDIYDTLKKFQEIGIKRVNIREPYGQPHIGNPFLNLTARAKELGIEYLKETLGMQTYSLKDMEITYWDVHYGEVELKPCSILKSAFLVKINLDPRIDSSCLEILSIFFKSSA